MPMKVTDSLQNLSRVCSDSVNVIAQTSISSPNVVTQRALVWNKINLMLAGFAQRTFKAGGDTEEGEG